MPTRPVESTHDEVRHSSPEVARATAEAEPKAAGVESPSADQMQGANGLPRETNADDDDFGDQDIDTAGTAADDQSPTKSL